MFRCYGCGKEFEEPKALKDDAGVYYTSPCCKEGYEKVYKCNICGKYYFAEDICKDICYECAEKEYTDRLGLQYLDKHRDFYLEAYGVENVDKDLKEDLIEILEKVYKESIDMDKDWNNKLKKIKEYILDDMDVWIEFLKEEIKDAQQSEAKNS